MLESAETWVPMFNMTLIVISGVFLLAGYVFIRLKRVRLHRASMLTAATFAALFLVVYVTRALLLPTKQYTGEGAIRTFYLVLLGSHIIVAAAVAPFAIVTLRRALTGRYELHRRIARVTVPMWLYAVVTGWLVYVMLYDVFA